MDEKTSKVIYYKKIINRVSDNKGGKTYNTRCDNLKNRLEELRKERGLKQETLADVLEVSRQTIGSLENGRYNPSITLAFKIARYFDLSIEDIFIYEEGE